MRIQQRDRSMLLSVFARFACAFILACLSTGVNAAPPGGNQPPTVSLTSPTNGQSFTAPATINLTATASDPDGTVTLVEFFAGTTLIGTATSAPFTATWSNVAAGSYSLTARATDNGGATTTSAPVSISVSSATALVITSPANGAASYTTSTLTVTGTFEGPLDSTILVDNEQHSVLAEINGNNYVASVFTAVGANTITVKLSRPDGTSATRSISITGHSTPVVAFIGPSCNTFDAPANITLAVDAKTPGGTITQVQFFRGGSTLIGTATAPPYQINWTNVPTGTYNITANATSNFGLVGSAQMQVIVLGPNTPPLISITSPAGGANFQAPANIPITVNTSDPDGTVKTVEYFANGNPIGVSNVPPFGITWSNVSASAYALTARATDDRSGQTTSAPVNITVGPANQPPAVSLSAPANGASLSIASNVAMSATASDADGTINRVEFYAGASLIGTSTTPPYSVTWTPLASGPHTLIAKAFDNLETNTVSAPVNVTVTGAITYLHNDFAGNPIAATDAAGTILWKENFRPYGDRLNNPPAAATNRQWFHGKAADADTGLSYFGARYYDPTLGRFMGTDPQHFTEDNLHSFNRYAYGNNNPYRFIDPKGNSPVDVIFWLADAAQLGVAIYSGAGVGGAAVDFAISTASLFSPIPGAGQAVKAARAAEKVADAIRAGDKGVDATKYSGGAYGKLDRVQGLERHHMPADSISPMSTARGPSIQMDAADHARTSSYGSSASAKAYRQEIGSLIDQGKFRDAMAREIKDVRGISGTKYNQATREMLDYAKSTGHLNK